MAELLEGLLEGQCADQLSKVMVITVQWRLNQVKHGLEYIISTHPHPTHTSTHPHTKHTTQCTPEARLQDAQTKDTEVVSDCPVPEDVVDEEQHVLTLLVSEVLSHCQSSQGHSSSGTRGLVHLTIHQSHLQT